MSIIYSMDEAKTRFPTILRHVRAGNMVTITCGGKAVAEIRPIEQDLRENLTTEENSNHGSIICDNAGY